MKKSLRLSQLYVTLLYVKICLEWAHFLSSKPSLHIKGQFVEEKKMFLKIISDFDCEVLSFGYSKIRYISVSKMNAYPDTTIN